MPRDPFPRVREAREALRERAVQILEETLDTVAKAKDAGDYETAAKLLQWLMEHMPSDDDGTKIIDTSIDKQKQIESGPVAPTVQIGIAVGGVGGRPTIGTKVTNQLPAKEGEIVK